MLGNIEPLNKWPICQMITLRNALLIFAACSTLIRRAISTYLPLRLEFEAAQHSVQWTPGNWHRGHEGRYAPFFWHFSGFEFSRFDGESSPTHVPLMRAVGQRADYTYSL
jgi:hypothetical protein